MERRVKPLEMTDEEEGGADSVDSNIEALTLDPEIV